MVNIYNKRYILILLTELLKIGKIHVSNFGTFTINTIFTYFRTEKTENTRIIAPKFASLQAATTYIDIITLTTFMRIEKPNNAIEYHQRWFVQILGVDNAIRYDNLIKDI